MVAALAWALRPSIAGMVVAVITIVPTMVVADGDIAGIVVEDGDGRGTGINHRGDRAHCL